MPSFLACPACGSLNTYYRADAPGNQMPGLGDPWDLDDQIYLCRSCGHEFRDYQADEEECLNLVDLAYEAKLDRSTLLSFAERRRKPYLTTILRLYKGRATHFVTRAEAERWKAEYASAPKVGRRR